MKRKIEILPPSIYETQLQERILDLIRLIKTKTNAVQSKPELKTAGKIRIVRHKNALQFYHITQKNDTTGKYLPREKDDFAKKLIQYTYDTKVVKAAKKELLTIRKLLALEKVQAIFHKLAKNRRTIIEPVTLSDVQYAEQWLSQKYNGKDIYDAPEYYTANGEQVRSKSEVIIADTLSRLKIPYRYEYPLELKDGSTVNPDFCCLNLRTREEIYWEHFGLMDDPDYVTGTIKKIKSFQQNGLLLGKNFIFTMENSIFPLNPKFVQQTAEKYLM